MLFIETDDAKSEAAAKQASAQVQSMNGPLQPPGLMQGPPPGMPPFGGPPGQFGGPPFGMPPPGFQGNWGPGAPPPWAGGPPGPVPWGMPPNMMPGLAPPINAIEEAAIMSKIDPEIVAKASLWSEHKNPEGRFYYHNSKTAESVWEKPQALKDLESKC